MCLFSTPTMVWFKSKIAKTNKKIIITIKQNWNHNFGI
uniref:Uncharacterized protein n=1 Tax=Anguilla anguilla TaxID=7936 RepID=A0A0E9TK93_ANGAN